MWKCGNVKFCGSASTHVLLFRWQEISFSWGTTSQTILVQGLRVPQAWPIKVRVMIHAGLLGVSLGTFTASWERGRFLLFLVTKLVGYELGARSAHLCHLLSRATFAITETEANTVAMFPLRLVNSLHDFLPIPTWGYLCHCNWDCQRSSW